MPFFFFFKSSGVRQVDWFDLSNTFCITDMSYKCIQQLFQACTQTAAVLQPAPHLPGTDRHLFSLKGFFLYPHDVSPQLVHSSFKHFSSRQTDGCFFILASRPCLERVVAEAQWWHKTGPLVLCALLLLGGTLRRSTGSPFTPITVIHHACTNTLSEY